ncbi:hypothetical protein ANTRET_LOCUS4448 [Anthophora retusa]
MYRWLKEIKERSAKYLKKSSKIWIERKIIAILEKSHRKSSEEKEKNEKSEFYRITAKINDFTPHIERKRKRERKREGRRERKVRRSDIKIK